MDLEDTKQMGKGSWYNTTICAKLNGKIFEDYLKTGQKERYTLIFSVDAYYKEHVPIPSYASSGSGIPIPSKSYKKAHYSLGHTINSLENWLQCFDGNYHNKIAIYKRKMSELFKIIPISLPPKKVTIINKNFRQKSGHQALNGL